MDDIVAAMKTELFWFQLILAALVAGLVYRYGIVPLERMFLRLWHRYKATSDASAIVQERERLERVEELRGDTMKRIEARIQALQDLMMAAGGAALALLSVVLVVWWWAQDFSWWLPLTLILLALSSLFFIGYLLNWAERSTLVRKATEPSPTRHIDPEIVADQDRLSG